MTATKAKICVCRSFVFKNITDCCKEELSLGTILYTLADAVTRGDRDERSCKGSAAYSGILAHDTCLSMDIDCCKIKLV